MSQTLALKHTKLRPYRIILLSILLQLFNVANAQTESVDSIMERMHQLAKLYAESVKEYTAEVYIKSQMDIIKKNRGFRYIPGLFRIKDDENRFIVETFSDLHYTAPNIYDQKIKVYTGTLQEVKEIPGIKDYFHINVYKPFLIGRKLLSPLAPKSEKYYVFTLDSVTTDLQQGDEYHISFKPRNKSLQLIEGRMVVSKESLSVRRFAFRGKAELIDFSCDILMGELGSNQELLPTNHNLAVSYAFAGNVMEGYYETNICYNDILFSDTTITNRTSRGHNYNLTASFKLRCDNSAYKKDYERIDSLRPHPLSQSEMNIYKRKRQNDSIMNLRNDTITFSNKELWSSVGDFFLTDSKWTLSENTVLRNTSLLNPLMFSYSKTNGASYRLDLKVNSRFQNTQTLQVRTRLGYNFTHNEFYWNVGTEYKLWPEHLGTLRLNVGNGNRIGNSRIIDKLKEIPTDSVIDFDRLNLNLFKDLNFEISNHLEIINGLSFDVGFMFHRRTPAAPPNDTFRTADLPENVQEGLQVNVRPKYISFAPRIRMEWTPGQYYFMNGRQKTNLHSRFPTFILDYERGIKGVFGSTGVYERIEFDMQHQLRTGLLSNLYYRFGAGAFTNREETYFVDFTNFRKNNLPQDWNDEIGGVFQALDGRWYNASPYYIRGHITYEAPFLILRHLIKYTRHVQHERLYLNMLTMEHLGPYFEIGYGIGTFVFDMGLFLSLEKFNKIGFGYKFTIELFND